VVERVGDGASCGMAAAVNRTFVLRNEVNARQLWAFLRSNWLAMAQAGKPLAVIVMEHKAKRSNPQNNLYWAVLREIAENAWVNGRRYSDEEWHAEFKRKFIGIIELPGGGTDGISTTTLDVADFSAYIDRVTQYAIETLGVESCTV
jgi:hypothetical protein